MVRGELVWQRVLCPTDFSEYSQRALARAVRTARWFEARVTALHVVPWVPAPLPPDAGGTCLASAADLARTERESALRELERAVAPWAAEGVPIETRLTDGDPPHAIAAEAEGLPADLVVMGTHGRTGFDHLMLGSVAEKMLRLVSCPVLTVGRPEPPSWPGALFRRVLCAVDLTPGSAGTVELAASLARESLARVTLLHVREGVLGDEVKDQLHRAAAPVAARCAVEECVGSGSAWREILRVAEETYADLIVLGAHSGGALARFFLGSTVNQVVRHALCPVLTVRESARPARPQEHALRVLPAGT
jgi:nucleotide-binding universal stress UspA family protein